MANTSFVVCFLLLSLATGASAGVCYATSITNATSKSIEDYAESFVTEFKVLQEELGPVEDMEPGECNQFEFKEIAAEKTEAMATALAAVDVQTTAGVIGGPGCTGVAIGFGGAGAKALAFAIASAYTSAFIQVFGGEGPAAAQFAIAQNQAVASQCEIAYAEVECGSGVLGQGFSFKTCDDLANATAKVIVEAVSEALVEVYKCQDCTVC
eukprot:TRINITY_DN161_c0_g1_i1.p1 TRINITY_DN161_c0_g1~~TRINITY_DN161_c0_g1_i1.p1  ORF type:complete len:211 (+),score=34.92 TRINITY_DN161_c0_g1_i1:417-1049(+)